MIKVCRCGIFMGITSPQHDQTVTRGFCANCRREYFPRVKAGETLTFTTGVLGFTAFTLDRRTI